MPDITVSSRVYRQLLRRSLSFDDTAEAVIARLLDESEAPAEHEDGAVAPGQSQAPATPGSILPVKEYWVPILSFLAEVGGSAPASEVIEALDERMGDDLRDRDREVLTNGEVRWRNRARFARLRMKERGLLSDESPRGLWEITSIGRAYLKLEKKTLVG